jgi:prepilin-type N-terminal cleavage/methylation domain-containing protein
MASERRGSAGAFTLLEVMVSLIILALIAVVLGSAYLNVLNSYVAVAKGTQGDLDLAFARQQLMTLTDINAAEAGDEFTTADLPAQPGLPPVSSRDVKWTADIEPTTLPDLFTVTLTCVESSTALGVDSKTVAQTFMLLRPTWSDATVASNLRQAEKTRIAVLQGKQQQ